jgi:hypothetical protein
MMAVWLQHVDLLRWCRVSEQFTVAVLVPLCADSAANFFGVGLL